MDNIDRDVLPGSNAALRPNLASVFPYSRKGAILCTTRTREIATAIAGSEVITVKEMLPDVAQELLSSSLIDKHLLETEPDTAQDLLLDLAYLPLAITQAVAYINSTKLSISAYLELLRNTEDSIVQTLSRDFEDLNRYPESTNPVAGTWLVSFQRIQQEAPLAAELLSFLSCLKPVNTLDSMLPDDQPKENQIYAIGKLCTYSFLKRQEDEREYDMHRLVHLAARNWVWSGKRTESVQSKVVERLNGVYPYPEFENIELRDPLFPHARKALDDYQTEKTREWWSLCMKVGQSLFLDGRRREALERYSAAEEWTRVALLESEEDRLVSQHKLAEAYRVNDQADKAITLLEHVTKVRGTLSEDHPSRLTSQHALSRTYRVNGQADKAITILEHVVKVPIATLAEDHPDRLKSQHALGIAYRENDQADKAIKILEHVVKVREALPEGHQSRLVSQSAYPSIYS